MKSNNHEHDNLFAALLAFLYSIIKSFFDHIDFWAIAQSILCALAGYLAVRLFRYFFPEKTTKSKH